MALEKKQYTLKVVEDTPPAPESVIRLGTQKIGQKDPLPRLEVSPEDLKPSVRLNPPAIEVPEIRTHQPGIEALIESAAPAFVPLEQEWGEESEASRSIPWGWFALIGLVLATAVIWSLIGVKEAEVQAQKLEVSTESILGHEEQEELEASQLIEKIEARVHQFISAKSVDALAPLVRHPERVLPLMKDHYQSKPFAARSVARIRQLQPLTLDDRAAFWMVSASLTNGLNQDLVLEIENSGEPKVDWETSVCYQPMPWDQFVEERPSGVSLDFRVYIENDNFFSHEFSDSNRWDCFRLTALNGSEALFGYAAAGGELAQELRGLTEQNRGQRVTIIVRLLVPEGIQSRRGVIIEKILAPRWIYLDPPEP